jgi:hypothetical protein
MKKLILLLSAILLVSCREKQDPPHGIYFANGRHVPIDSCQEYKLEQALDFGFLDSYRRPRPDLPKDCAIEINKYGWYKGVFTIDDRELLYKFYALPQETYDQAVIEIIKVRKEQTRNLGPWVEYQDETGTGTVKWLMLNNLYVEDDKLQQK